MTKEKSLQERIADLEDKIDYLIYQKKANCEPELSENQFMTFYSRTEEYFENVGAPFGLITINSRFENILKHKVLYPDYDYGLWYPIGKTNKDIPIDFKNMQYDYTLETYGAGNFETAKLDNVRGSK